MLDSNFKPAMLIHEGDPEQSQGLNSTNKIPMAYFQQDDIVQTEPEQDAEQAEDPEPVAELSNEDEQPLVMDYTTDIATMINFALQQPHRVNIDFKRVLLKRITTSEQEKIELRGKLSLKDTEMQDLRNEVDNLKRRIERKESEYIQTMKANTILQTQVTALQNRESIDKKVRVDPSIADLRQVNLQQENQITEFRAKLDEAIQMMRFQHTTFEGEKQEIKGQMVEENKALQNVIRKKDIQISTLKNKLASYEAVSY